MVYLIIGIIIIILMLLGLTDYKNKNFYIVMTLIVAIVFINLGEFKFPDYYAYKLLYNMKSNYDVEKGFVLLTIIGKFYKLNYNEFLFFLRTIETILIYTFFIKNKSFERINIIFLTLYFFPMIANLQSALRQGIAIVIFIISFKYILEKKFFKYILCLIVASFFHKSILILIPFYFSTKLRMTSNRILKILVVSNIIYFGNNIFQIFILKVSKILANILVGYSYIGRYDIVDYLGNVNLKILGWIELNLIIFSIIFLKKYNLLKVSNDKLSRLLNCGVLLYLINNSIKLGIISHRINYYLLIFKFLYIANILANLKLKKSLKMGIIVIVTIYFIGFSLFKSYEIFNVRGLFYQYKNIIFLQ